MLGFIKKLFTKRSTQESTQAIAPLHDAPSPQPGSLPAAPPPAATAPPPAAPPAPSPAAAPLPPPPPRPRSRNKMERVLLPLKTITDAIPEALQPLIAEAPEPTVMIALPVDRIVAQLPQGRVEVAIGQLRRVAPPTIFIPETDWDEQMVEIPLQELLPKLDPTLLKRRTQRKIDLPLDEDVFQRRRLEGEADEPGDGLGMTLETPTDEELSAAAAATPAAPAMPPPPPAPPAPAAVPMPAASASPSISAPKDLHSLFGSTAPKPAAPPATAPASIPPPAASIPASTPAPVLKLQPEAPLPQPPQSPAAPTAPAALATPTAPPIIKLGEPLATDAGTPEPAPISLKLAAEEPLPATPAAAAIPITDADTANPLNPLSLSPKPAPAPRGAVVHLPLHKVAAQWPESIREEISGLSQETHIEYPLEPLGTLLKRGKVTAHWRELRSWIPGLHDAPSLYDDTLLELPLPIVAPLYMAASGGRQAPQKRAVVDESIPSPFTPAAPAAPPAPPAPAPEAAAAADATTAPAAPQAAAQEPALAGNAKPMGALGLDEAIPATLIERACALGGVAGSVIALKDGLLVAARTPEEFKAETIAAFLPQVFSRVESAAGSMQIGEFQTLMFTAGDRPWQIWKAGGLFFAAIGRPNELLPSAQLKIIAGQLARQTQV